MGSSPPEKKNQSPRNVLPQTIFRSHPREVWCGFVQQILTCFNDTCAYVGVRVRTYVILLLPESESVRENERTQKF